MAGLLDVTVTGEPGEIVPVAQLPFEIAHARRTIRCRRHRFDRAGIVGRVNSSNLPNGTGMNALVKLTAWSVVAPAETRNQCEILVFSKLGRFHYGAQPG